MTAEEYEAERRIVGDLDELDKAVASVKVPARSGSSGEDLLKVLEGIRAEDPEEPFWKGVKELTAGDNHVQVEWFEPVEPHLVQSGPVQVECHLYDEDALAEAERRRGAVVSP
jgi:peptide/nickel transport system ATP-binding protein